MGISLMRIVLMVHASARVNIDRIHPKLKISPGSLLKPENYHETHIGVYTPAKVF
jgi:hypothetical protein